MSKNMKAFEVVTDECGLTRAVPGLCFIGPSRVEPSLNLTPNSRICLVPHVIPDGYRMITDEERKGRKTGVERFLNDSGDWETSTLPSFSSHDTYIVPMDYGKEPTIRVTVEVNGEKVDPSTISEETWANIRKVQA